ncbi:MAG: polysaccharide biosynthesis protein [Acidimicrobiales bacterium]
MSLSAGGRERRSLGIVDRFGPTLARRRLLVQCVIDCTAWAVALVGADLSRYDFDVRRLVPADLLAVITLAALAQLVTGMSAGLYTGRWRFGSFDEVAALVRSTVATTTVLFLANLWISRSPLLVPRSVPVGGGLAALVLMGGMRYGWRLVLEKRRRPAGEGVGRILVFGAGEGGAQVITAMLRDPNSPYVPVALLDDDPAKGNLRIMGVPVVGGRSRLGAAAAEAGATAVLVAIPSAGAALVTELADLASQTDLDLKVLPPVGELFGGRVGVDDIRDVTTADLLGRHEIETDVASIAGYITGRRVLVTGAGGSIGSELCRQIYRFAPNRLVMVDRDESALHAVQLSIDGRALLDSPNLVLCDLRDRDALDEVLAACLPEVVFHAAALKHLPLLERHPAEAVKTNVWATMHLLDASVRHGVDRFVNISTDKAADPTSVLGYSKRLAERLTAHVAQDTGKAYLSVRFGNVLGSRGSVLTTFEAQVQRGGPLTVTHPEVTRYFMTVEEAVQLVIQAGAIGRPGEALVLDMGQPVCIAEVADLLAARSSRSITIEYTGLRPGEKLHEVLLGHDEVDARPTHPLISQVDVPPLDPKVAQAIDVSGDEATVTGVLGALCRSEARMAERER